MKLLFIYNANSGPLNALWDIGHKLIRPSTYPCNLCAITYGTFTERKHWKHSRDKSPIDMVFYHKDEFERQFPNVKIIYPSVLKLEGHLLSTVLTPEVINDIHDIETLVERLKLNI